MAIREVRPDDDSAPHGAATHDDSYVRVDDTPARPPARRTESIDLQQIEQSRGVLGFAARVLGVPDSGERALQRRLRAYQEGVIQDDIHRVNDEVQFRSETRDADSVEATFNYLDPYLRRHPEGTVMGNYYRRLLKQSIERREQSSQALHDAGVRRRNRLLDA